MNTSYRQDMRAAWERVRAMPSDLLDTPAGPVEYAVSGVGPPVLVSHGILGSHVEGLGMAKTYVSDDVRAIAPSRFGYLGSALPSDATPAMQADVYVRLLDHLGVDRAVVLGFSAGGTSAIELALRRPERVSALVLTSSALPPASGLPKVARPFMSVAARSDRVFWLFARLMPGILHGLMGVPKNYDPSPEESETIRSVTASIFPVHPRRSGFIFDAFVGNLWVRNARLEQLDVPTLIIHAVDDSLAPYTNATGAAKRIPGAALVTIEQGGHLFLGQEQRVRDEIASFLSTPVHATRLHVDRQGPQVRVRHPMTSEASPNAVSLYWLPVGAGAQLARRCVPIYEAVAAAREHRDRCQLYHAALQVRLDGQRYVIESAPVWDRPEPDRGVVCEGPVGTRWLGRSKWFRYEVRRWRDGLIPDVAYAVDSPQRLSSNRQQAVSVLDLAPAFPALTWGRDELHTGDMWNSNSLVSWLLVNTRHDIDQIRPPVRGRAPGWTAGIVAARRGGVSDPLVAARSSR